MLLDTLGSLLQRCLSETLRLIGKPIYWPSHLQSTSARHRSGLLVAKGKRQQAEVGQGRGRKQIEGIHLTPVSSFVRSCSNASFVRSCYNASYISSIIPEHKCCDE